MNIVIASPLRVNNPIEGYHFFEDFADLFPKNEDLQNIHVIFFTKSCGGTFFSGNFFLHAIRLPFEIGKNPITSLLSIILGQLNLLTLLLRMIKAYNIQIIEANDLLFTAPPSLLAAKLSRIISTLYIAGPIEETVKHKLAFFELKGLVIKLALKLIGLIKRIVISGVDHVFCVTSYLIEDAKKHGAKSVSWTPTDINAKIFKPMEVFKEKDKPRILYIGRLDPDKGISHLIDAFRIVRSQVDAELHLIGDGLERKRLRQKVMSYALSDYVFFHGIVPHHRIPLEINKCDVVVLPSFSEGIPRVAVEASLCLKPVILTPISAASGFFVHEIHAIIVPPGDPYKLAEFLIKVLMDKALQKRLATNARNLVQEKLLSYGIEHIKVYKKLLRRKEKIVSK
jgi:glycosyltransferase involved in cell wall biosynthesis